MERDITFRIENVEVEHGHGSSIFFCYGCFFIEGSSLFGSLLEREREGQRSSMDTYSEITEVALSEAFANFFIFLEMPLGRALSGETSPL